MSKWFDRNWYRYVWRRKLSFEMQAFLVVLAVAFVLLGGFFAADQLASASGTSSGAYIIHSTTVTRIVRSTHNGKTIVRRYPVVHTVRIKAQPVTVQNFQTVTTPGRTKVISVTTVKYVPVKQVVTNVVTKNGKTTTVATTVAQTQTQVQTVTNELTNTVVMTQPVTTKSTVIQTTTRVTTALQTVTTTKTVIQTQTVTTAKTVTVPVTITVKL